MHTYTIIITTANWETSILSPIHKKQDIQDQSLLSGQPNDSPASLAAQVETLDCLMLSLFVFASQRTHTNTSL